ncbi:sec-independent protein translocase protein TatB [Inhella inkyongensis]|uniref:Sec-independent protein translocase protein TatB n=1 Tax=Inhella inkyongensis TaxID=392593 RepID=A0A840S4Z6_9BURK|nr:Sec-independent protein translocase protein TatB [Inhella inkyongensis]MBB5204548.1 sec-independent protein translocase protein TatB [Inhella inkyongensis]
MLDLGLDKLALVGAVALIVIGPEKLPKVARTVGHLLGKARRYVSDVKAEVNRSMELEELNKVKNQFQTAAQEVSAGFQDVQSGLNEVQTEFNEAFSESNDWAASGPSYQHPKKNWRVKRAATPMWFKQRAGVRRHVQSGAARVARFKPR